MKLILRLTLVVIFFMPSLVSFAQDDDLDLLDLDLEQLLQVEVTSVSKTAERLQDVQTSLYVLTAEDIEKSGATQLHELLMLVPGYWGVQTNYSNVEFGMRYSAPENGNVGSTLFLLDGTPMQELMDGGFSWRNFDIPLEEIERIEVIKGSGGTIYGANSATGVISIFTKNPDGNKGASFKIDGGNHGYISASVRGNASIGKLSIGGYAKLRNFEGYGLLPEFDGERVSVIGLDGSTVTIDNRFTEDFERLWSSTFGTKIKYKISDKSTISYANHVNLSDKISYTAASNPNTFFTTDRLYTNQINRSRVVSNIRFDTEFSDNHSLFARISTNREDDFYNTSGGNQTSNTILDFELQDNLVMGDFINLAFGGNYRLVHFDIYNINAPDLLGYVNPLSNESLYGFFAQEKLSFADGKVNFTIGGKAETFTLVNDNFYFSPQLKFSYLPSENLTFWGGYSKSYTTPGFNQTNVDFSLFRAPAYEMFYMIAYPQVYQAVYQAAYDQAFLITGDDATSAALAQDYVDSPQGQQDINTNTDAAAVTYSDPYVDAATGANTYNIGVKNGSDTKPTSFTNYEFGVRTSAVKNMMIEANGFFTIIADGITPSRNTVLDAQQMQAIPNSYADYYFYGNYSKGVSKGVEAVVKYMPNKNLNVEASYTYVNTEMEYQKNPDFDISAMTENQRNLTRDVPLIPESIFRMKFSYKTDNGIGFALNGLYASMYDSDSKYIYEQQNWESLVAGEAGLAKGVLVAENQDRIIVNAKISKDFNNGLSAYVYGNDLSNFEGRIENTNNLGEITISQTSALIGLGLKFNFGRE